MLSLDNDRYLIKDYTESESETLRSINIATEDVQRMYFKSLLAHLTQLANPNKDLFSL